MNVRSALGLLVAALLLGGCSSSDKPCVLIQPQDAARQAVRVSVELAQTAGQRSMGLMYRRKLGWSKGMLFLFEHEREHQFTMRNTPIALDMIFMDRGRRIVGIIENTKPYANGPFSIARKSMYVLEVNAGFCKKKGIGGGDTLTFHNLPAK